MPPLRSVSVPDSMRPLFEAAEDVVARYFSEQHYDPERGTIEIHGERYVTVRAAALSVEFFELVEELFGGEREREAHDFAANILFDLAHSIGRTDARNFHSRMGLKDPIAKLSAGPVHFAHTGWAYVDIHADSVASPDPDQYCLLYDHPYSFESDAWLRAGRDAAFPVCVMNSGYSSGWCEESFGLQLVATEVMCRARGDEACRFVMAPPDRIAGHLERLFAEADSRYRPPGSSHGTGHGPIQIPDLFERKQLETELRAARDDLERRVEQRTEELRRANQQLTAEIAERERMEQRLLQSQKLEAIGHLAGGIAHDFNNILTVVLGYAEMLNDGTASRDEIADGATQIEQATRRAMRLTDQLLVFSRQKVMQAEVLDINSVVADMSAMLGRVIGEDIILETLVPREPSPVQMHHSQLEQVLLNLVVNARDAMPTGGRLQIRVERVQLDAGTAAGLDLRAGEWLALRVNDTGHGMDEETRAHIFEPFFTTRQPGHGTGLGLATVYGVVRACQGAIAVDSEPGAGSTFHVYLPLSTDPVGDESEPPPTAEHPRPA